MNVDSSIVEAVHKTLDENSDGSVSMEEFAFIIDSEIQKQKKYREIMGEIDTIDPIEIEARIIDMRAKIQFMDNKMENYEDQ